MANQTMPALPLAGGCQCGALRYAIAAAPTALYCCHCTQCQAQAAGAFGMSLLVPGDGLELRGERMEWVRGEAEGAVHCLACPRCGSRVAHVDRRRTGEASVKAGSLDDRRWLHPVGHIWTASAQPWVRPFLDGLVYEGQPPDGFAALRAAFAARPEVAVAGPSAGR